MHIEAVLDADQCGQQTHGTRARNQRARGRNATARGNSIDLNGGLLTDVFCRTSSFCAGVDRYGQAFTFDGTGWSPPVDTQPYPQVEGFDVSCGTAKRCVITAQAGDVVYGTA